VHTHTYTHIVHTHTHIVHTHTHTHSAYTHTHIGHTHTYTHTHTRICVFVCFESPIMPLRAHSHRDKPPSVGILYTSDRQVADPTHKRQILMLRRDSNPHFQQASSRRPKP